jgi:hypothetical protein
MGRKSLGILPDLLCDRVRLAERAGFVRLIVFDDADDLFRIDLHHWRADAIRRLVQRNFPTVGGIGGLVNVVHAVEVFDVVTVDLNEDPVCLGAVGRGRADGGGKGDFALIIHIADLDHRPMDRAEETVTDALRDHG